MAGKKRDDLAKAITAHAWAMAQSGELQAKRADLAEQIASDLVKPPKEPVQFVDEFTNLLKDFKPRPPAELRANDFATIISPRLAQFGFEERYRQDGLLTGTDLRIAQQKEVLAKIRARCKGVGAIVALVGPRGTGKTSLVAEFAAERLWEDLATGREVQTYTSSLDRRPVPNRITAYRKLTAIVAKLKALYGDFGTIAIATLESIRNHLARVECLIIDELAEVADDSKHKDRILTDLLDLRYAAKRDTIVISNQTKADFETSINPSIASRIREHGSVIRCEWQSFREQPVQRP